MYMHTHTHTERCMSVWAWVYSKLGTSGELLILKVYIPSLTNPGFSTSRELLCTGVHFKNKKLVYTSSLLRLFPFCTYCEITHIASLVIILSNDIFYTELKQASLAWLYVWMYYCTEFYLTKFLEHFILHTPVLLVALPSVASVCIESNFFWERETERNTGSRFPCMPCNLSNDILVPLLAINNQMLF